MNGEGWEVRGCYGPRPSSFACLGLRFELESREASRHLAGINGVAGRVSLRGACDRAALAQILSPGTLVICDVEGSEVELLRPESVPRLKDSFLIVELHEFLDPERSRALLERFPATHEVKLIEAGL